MNLLIKLTLILVLTLQSSAPQAVASPNDDDVICNDCIDRDAQPGSIVNVDGDTWKLIELETVDGVSMWSAIPFDAWGDTSGESFDRGFNTADRLTGRDLSGFEDSDARSPSQREELYEIRQKIVDRLNEETRVDAEATNKELAPQLESLNQLVQSAGNIAYRGADLSIGSVDPILALYDSLKSQPGNSDFYIEQSGWQQIDDREYQSNRKTELEALRIRLNYSIPKSPQQADAKRAGYNVLAEADKAYVSKDEDLGNSFLQIAKTLVDIATDIIPITSAPKDFYRAVIGKDPMTGEVLEKWERTFAGGFFVAGIISLGSSNLAKSWIRSVAKVSKTREQVVTTAAKLSTSLEKQNSIRNIIVSAKNRLSDVKLLDPVRENKKLTQNLGYKQLAWNEKQIIFSGITKREEKFVRFFSENKEGLWFTDMDKMVGKNAEQIRELLAMPKAPTHYTIVTIPAGVEISSGFVGANAWGGNKAAVQHFILDPKPRYYGQANKIKEVFRGIK